jgi:uncharacterized protein
VQVIDPAVIALLAGVAAVAGTVDAIAGGGGLLTVPALLAAGLPPHIALATNKGQSTWGSCASSLAYWRAGHADRRLAARTFPLGVGGALAGAALQLVVAPEVLRPIVIAMLVGAVVVMIARKPAGDRDDPELRHRRWPLACAIAGVVGCYDGFFGPPTGTILAIGFAALCGRGLVGATADAKVVNFAANIAALGLFAAAGNVIWQIALPMAAAQMLGGIVGARLAMRGGGRIVRVGLVVVCSVLIGKLALQLFS